MMKCPQCGTENEDASTFCENCGADLPRDKECPVCHARVKLSAHFCGKCRYDFGTGAAGGAGPGGLSMGDGNVIAGDVVGRQENIRITGNATIVRNEDETKKMVKCHVCGRNIAITRSVTCPVCQEMTCENCFDTSLRACTKCIQQKNANREDVYVDALRKALEDGRMTLAERQELNALQRRLGIGAERASELERLTKSGTAAAKDASPLTGYVRLSLQKALDLLYDEGDASKAYDSLLPIYKRYPENEEVLTGFLNAAVKVDPEEAFGIIRRNQADVAGMHLVCIDSDLINGDLASADERLAVATRLWPDDLLVACRRMLCLTAMFDKLHDGAFLRQAEELLSSVSEPRNKLESSWLCRAKNAVRMAMGDKVPKITRDYCRSNDLYFAVASGRGSLFQRALAARETDVELYVGLLSELAEDGHPDAQRLLGECYHDSIGVEQDYAAAAKWYRKAAEQGDADAQNRFGECCFNGSGVDEDEEAAVEWYRRSADQGNRFAQNNLGFCYENGRGVVRDLREAVNWYRKAAEQGHVRAQCNLAFCYEKGRGVGQDRGEAVKWYRKAAAEGYGSAIMALKRMGYGV